MDRCSWCEEVATATNALPDGSDPQPACDMHATYDWGIEMAVQS